MPPPPWRVGELARATGLTVRTLHHYHAIGLLSPSGRTESGHRLYTEADVARLQQVVSLRSLGLSLDEVRESLGRPGLSLLQVLELHLERLRAQVAAQERLCSRLERIAVALRAAEAVSVEELVRTIEETNKVEKYYTQEQLQELEARRNALGDEGMRQAERDWAELIEQVRAEMDRGTDPSDPRVRELAERWMDLVNAFTGGNPETMASLKRMWQEEETIHGMETGPMREMGAYIARAMPQE